MTDQLTSLAEDCAKRVRKVNPNLTKSAYLTAWLATMKWIDSQLRVNRGAALANFGKFTLSTGPSGSITPVFVLNEQFARRYGIHTEVILKRKLEPIEDINYSRIALQYSKVLSKDVVQTCLKHLLNEINGKISSGISMSINFGFGVLHARGMKVVFKFGGGGYTTLSSATKELEAERGHQRRGSRQNPPSAGSQGGPEGGEASMGSTGKSSLGVSSSSYAPSKTKKKIIPEEFESVVSKDAYLRHLKSERAMKKTEKSLDKYNLQRRKQLDSQAKVVVQQKEASNRQVQEYLKAQIAEKEERSRREKQDNTRAVNNVPLYPAEISCSSPQDVRKQKLEYKTFLEQQMLEKKSLKKAQRKKELSQDWELLNDVEEDLALSRLEQVEIKKLKQRQLNEGWREQIEARK
ncbi:hypothetical protein HOP50_05g37640 [Chloropicon primus]|uniref:CCDC81 HU domain-containing protein n=1 Tax=Chloropicon primus TaxID=1764295 RepID=A0A5B8ML82_9CHLO|nr:hypothetical protein A3770_05p37540 [Chloropicon primus]UPR00450.1 hypothetical protein HOP50_05g37640 [Chloropicon primus]|eukprot:QDZ21236.1 hypothetical protein A3770_05p37540 [Chloropicon primus]